MNEDMYTIHVHIGNMCMVLVFPIKSYYNFDENMLTVFFFLHFWFDTF